MFKKPQQRQLMAFLAGALAVVYAPDLFNQTLGRLLKKTVVEVSGTASS
jgi:hypothetical protein